MKYAALILAIAGCASSRNVPIARFANEPPVQIVNDRRDVPKQPEELVYDRYIKNFDGSFHRLITRKLELKRPERARGVNQLDEVPDSTWFTNRIGAHDIPVEQITNMPGSIGTPEDYKPWTIESTKVGGLSIGFIIKDTRDEKWLLKFDRKGFPEAETATQIIIGRLLWAIGYNVTDDYVVRVRKEDLILAPDAKIKDPNGESMPLDQREVDARLATIDVAKDGTMRALVSRYLDGKPLGGHPAEGVRKDDPNDLIPHELRRDLRGTHAIFEWLDHSDLHLANSLDMYVTDPADPKRHYVKHYFIDFGIALGFGAAKNHNLRYGYEYQVDWKAMAQSLFTFGLVQRPWEDRDQPHLRGVGVYDVEKYDPGTWKPLTPMYTPVRTADRIDDFWASKIMMKLTREHIKAAVDAAHLSDPRAAAWLVEALIARQRKTAKYWFERVNPLDEFKATDRGLCFKDLSIIYSFAQARATHYRATFFDRNGKRLARGQRFEPNTSGVTCSPLQLSAGHEGYTIVRLDTTRPGFAGSTYVHVARDERTLAPRVIGIWRK
ncbi:MAG TPA: hypothetical protein VIV40_35370 [Kofleriaceae bacterium]